MELQRRLGDGFHVGNFGVGGCTATRTDRNKECKGTKAFEDAIRFKPHAVVLMMGTNDAKDGTWDPPAYPDALVQVAQELMARPSSGFKGRPQISPAWVFAIPPPVTKPNYASISPRIIRDEIPEGVRQAAEKLQRLLDSSHNASDASPRDPCSPGRVEILDLQESFAAEGCRWCETCPPEQLEQDDRCGRLILPDGIHTTVFGSVFIAKTVAAVLGNCKPPAAMLSS